MKSETLVRVMAGCMILLSVALTHFVSPWWLLLTCFVGLNLIQSAFTGFCPPVIVARKFGLINDGECCEGKGTGKGHPAA